MKLTLPTLLNPSVNVTISALGLGLEVHGYLRNVPQLNKTPFHSLGSAIR